MSIVPPHAPDDEESVIGACLLNGKAVDLVYDILAPEHFYRPSHGVIFKAILDVHDKAEPVDALTVVGRLDADGLLEQAGGAVRVHELAGIVPAASNAAHYAKRVRAMWLRREILRVGHELVALGNTGANSVTDLLAEADNKVMSIGQLARGKKAERVFTGKQLMSDYRKILNEPLDEGQIGVRPPFTFLSPLMGSRLYVLSGYSGHGKTASALQFVGSACEGGARVGVETIEMSREDLAHRLVAARASAPYHEVRLGKVSSFHRHNVEKALDEIEDWDFEVIDDSGVDAAQIRRDQRAGKYDLLIVDHLHNISIRDKRHERQELEETVRQLTAIAKEFNIPVLLLAQLSRHDKREPFPRPTLSDLKGTGAIEQLASHVWFIWRKPDEFHNPTTETEFIVAKNRYGGLGAYNLHFRASQVRFTESQYG